ncbi:MAG: DNA internalization-related competence protein ComEC/Rec2 [Oscillospiraceae bacterium]|nr:DNA internalization-related competence protein ComEC/Rec2 [Oscillospiraceae bacterium]
MRRLAYAAFSFAAAVLLAQYLLPRALWPYAAALAALAGLAAFLLSGKARTRTMIICFAACAGLLWNLAYAELIVRPAESLAEEKRTYTASVLDYPQKGEYSTSQLAELKRGNKKIRILLRAYDGSLDGSAPGDTVSFKTALKSCAANEEDYYTAKGVFLRGNVSGAQISKGSGKDLRYLPAKLAFALKKQAEKLFEPGQAGFVKALLTGDKTGLGPELSSVLKVSGISHVVAVSGMHLSFIVGFITLAVGRKRRAAIVCIPVILFFMAMVGNTPSVVRAGIMQIMLLAAPVFRREADSVTDLAFALAILLAVNPYSIKSPGLQLSFAAAAGIIFITPRIYKKLAGLTEKPEKRIVVKLKNAAASALAATLGASVLTVPLCALHFGSFSIIAPLTNVLVLWAVSLAFVLSLLACIFGLLCPPLGIALAFLARWPITWILFAAKCVAAIPYASIGFSGVCIRAWMAFAVIAAVVAFADKHFRLRLLMVGEAVTLTLAVAVTIAVSSSGEMTFAVLDIGQGQCAAVVSGGYSALIDCGGSFAGTVGDTAAEYIALAGAPRLDCLILTHYDADHTNGAEALFARTKVSALIMPVIAGENEKAAQLEQLAKKNGTEVIYISENMRMPLGEAEITLLPSDSKDGGQNENCMAVLVSCGGFEALATGDMNSKAEEKLLGRAKLPDIELLIAGHHGAKDASSQRLLERTKPEVAVISVGTNSYGHPAKETIERLAAYGAEVYRTDECGTVTVRVNG